MVLRVAVAVVGLALASCGDNTAPITIQNGSRLAVRVFAYEDGTQQLDLAGARDTRRGEDCNSARWIDGNRYCTPVAVPTAFSDPQCLTKVGVSSAGSAVRYAEDIGVDGQVAALHALGAPYLGASTFTWRLDSGHCAGPFAAPPDAVFFQLGDELTHDAFVRVKQDAPRGADRVRVVDVTGEDGLRVPSTLFDSRLSIECATRTTAYGTHECAPTSEVTASFYVDDACTARAAAVETISLPDAIVVSSDGHLRDFALGEPSSTRQLRTAPGCVAVDVPDGARVFTLGPALGLAPLSPTRVGNSRIRLIEDVPSFHEPYVYDSVLDVECAPRFIDGALRCVPDPYAAPITTHFQDPACTIPISVAYLPTSDRAVRLIQDDGHHWRSLGDPAEVYTGGLESPCEPAQTPAGADARPASEPLAPSTFAAVTAQLLAD